jgi:transcriptional regulator with XRE-family HTH domain
MPEESPLYKQLLGTQLSQLREQAEVTLEEAAKKLDRTTRTVRRFESGDNLPDGHQLSTMCELYGCTGDTRVRLENLHHLARQPVWWSHLGPRPHATAAMLSMEELAFRIRDYDPNAIPGLLQTVAYATETIEAVDIDTSPQQAQTNVELRMGRQSKIWESNRAPEATFLIDESVFYRMPGTGPGKRAQLVRLLTPPASVAIQVVQFSAGPHSSLGAYRIFDLDLDSSTTSKGVFVEGSTTEQGVVIESEGDIAKYELAFERTRAKALSVKESVRFIKDQIRSIQDD